MFSYYLLELNNYKSMNRKNCYELLLNLLEELFSFKLVFKKFNSMNTENCNESKNKF